MPITTDMLIEFVLIIGVAFAIFKAGSMYTIWKIQQELIALENGEIEFDEEDDDDDIIASAELLDLVKADEKYYAYGGSNNRFIAQDSSLEGLIHTISKAEPGKTWLIGNSDDSLSKEEERQITIILQEMFETKEGK